MKGYRFYTKPEIISILQDFRLSGKTRCGFCKMPGAPCLNTLNKWLMMEKAGLIEVPKVEVRGSAEGHRPHTPYSQETRDEAVRLYRQGMRPREVERRLGLPKDQLRNFLHSRDKGRQKPKVAPEVSHMPEESEKKVPEKEARKKRPKRERQKMPDDKDVRIAVLRRELADKTLEVRALMELMRDPKAGDPENLSRMQLAELLEKLRKDYGYCLKRLLTFFAMPKSTYEYELKMRDKRKKRLEKDVEVCQEAFDESGGTYGYRRVKASVDGRGYRISEKRARRAMKQARMVARRPGVRKRYSSYKGENGRRPKNLLLRKDGSHAFTAHHAGRLVVTDVSEFRVGPQGRYKVYLSPFLDCFDGEPLSWSISTHPDSRLTDTSLKACLEKTGPVTLHTDGGGPYTSDSWLELCHEHDVTRSMSRKGHCADNARAEGFFGTIKEEFFYGRDWSKTTPLRFKDALDGYLIWYRDGRLKAFKDEEGHTYYDTISGRRKRLGLQV